MSYIHHCQNESCEVESTARFMLVQLFGENVRLATQFEFLPIKDKMALEPEYYFTDRFRFFDFWYNPDQEWLPQLAVAISDYYHSLTGIEGDKITTANHLLSCYSD